MKSRIACARRVDYAIPRGEEVSIFIHGVFEKYIEAECAGF
jgi:hypothetical protein